MTHKNTPPIRSQVRWHCRRGMLELDTLLTNFFDSHYDTLSVKQQQAFAELLTHSDPELMDWLTHHTLPDDLQHI